MKLYTEEQVRKAYKDGNLDGFSNVSALDMCIDSLTPIEVPSDEDIEEQAIDITSLTSGYGKTIAVTFYEAGAKWMKEQILNQNK